MKKAKEPEPKKPEADTNPLKAATLELPENFELSEEFKQCFHELENTRRNLYITGEAGTGKTTLLKYFRKNTKKNIVVLAPTGIAAINCYGQTIHSFFKFPAKLLQKENVRRVYHGEKIFSALDMVIIDEASMMRADLLDAVDHALRINMHEPNTPFGGVQMVLFGDLYQLPPIIDRPSRDIYAQLYASPYFFSANIFREARFRQLELEKIYRQNDVEFTDILNKIRNKTLKSGDLSILNTRTRHTGKEASALEDCITLTPTNAAAAAINDARLAKLKTDAFDYEAEIHGEFDEASYPTEVSLKLKVGAQVLMIQNDPGKRWVNGSVGEITKLNENSIEVRIENESYEVDKARWKKIKYKHDEELERITEEEVGGFEQYPIKLAWAITIHKSQGLTFDRVIVDFDTGTFAHGQAYVALSRCRSLEGLVLKRPLSPSDIIFDPRIAKYHAPQESSEVIPCEND